MTRRGLSILVGIAGTIVAALTLLLLLVMGSVFADARTENIAGPGVDVFVRTPFPGEGSTVVLDVEARGGSRAGIDDIEIYWGEVPFASHRGKGVTWGPMIRSGRSRGSDTETVKLPVPSEVKAGQTFPLAIEVDYVVAMSNSGSFSNERKHARVNLVLMVYSSSGRHLAQLARVGLAFGCFALWFLLVWGVAKLYANAREVDGRHNAEMEGIGLLMGFMGGSILGYWLFAWRIMNALELASTWWAFLLMTIWCVAPLVFVWKWWKRRKNRADLPAARVIAR